MVSANTITTRQIDDVPLLRDLVTSLWSVDITTECLVHKFNNLKPSTSACIDNMYSKILKNMVSVFIKGVFTIVQYL